METDNTLDTVGLRKENYNLKIAVITDSDVKTQQIKCENANFTKLHIKSI